MKKEFDEKKLNEYLQRQKEWRDISTQQLSFSNNILITIAAGYLVLIFDKSELRKVEINLNSSIDWPILLYFVSVLLAIAAILLGVMVMINRLYDFRISRHIALTRKRVYKKHTEVLSESTLGAISSWDIITGQFNIMFKKIEFIAIDEIDSFEANKESISTKFNLLRRQSKVIGSTSHKWTKIQILLMLVSLIIYTCYIIG